MSSEASDKRGNALAIEFATVTEENVEELRKINTACFPVQYNDGFYQAVVAQPNAGLNKLALWRGTVIGAVCTRIEPLIHERHRLYIMTLGVLAAYRGRQVGTQLIQSILDYFEQEKDNTESVLSTVDEISLHVQISNEDAIRFYMTRFGFKRGELVMNYYRRIEPPHCYRLHRKLR